jgi:8-oxo-dGTP diphosphatase
MNKQVVVSCGVVIKEGKALMQQRFAPDISQTHLKWEFPGGKVEFDETAEQAVIREVFEETRVRVKVLRLIPFVQVSYWEYKWGIQKSVCLAYLCEFLSQEKTEKDHGVEKVEWIEIDKIKRLDSLPGTNEIIEEAKKLIA